MKNYMYILLVSVIWLSCTDRSQNQDAVKNQEFAIPDRSEFNVPNGLQWRFIGPIVGNRGSFAIGHPTEPYTFYHGASNGLWKTEDAGQYWQPVGDEYFTSGNMGAMEFSLSNPDIAYVGTGEPQMRNNVSWGDGVYKTTDNGKTWTHLGLEETHHISQVRVHPTNPDIVFVGAFGHAFGPNEERGVYRTKDGGDTWEKVLYKSDNAGVIDLVMNPSNPNELFAAMWEFERKAWGPKTGGPNSGIWRSTDGGDNWEEITYNNGLPEGGRGRTGLTMSAADSKKVYAIIDSETKPALYVSNDLGENWELVSDFFQIIGRPFYYMQIYASPHNANELWCPNNRLFKSTDGGKNWELEPGVKDDFHDIWICPNDPNRMMASCDGGCQVSMTGGLTWSTQHTQKNSQFYRVDVDDDFPYNVYSNAQDLVAYKVPSASRWGGISGHETTIIGNGELGSVIPKPGDLNTVYNLSAGSPTGPGGSFTVNNLKTGQNNVRNVSPSPLSGLNAYELEYRFNWVTPYFVSPHDPNTIYLGGNVMFKTTDEGLNWEIISPDLTNDIRDRQKISGTPWLSEYFGQEVYSTIHRMAESPLKKGIIWTGSDDGKIFITKNGGGNWEDISITEGVPEYSQVYEIEPSPHDAATAYVVFSNFNTYDDYKPYIFKTTDYGKSWTNLSGNFPQTEITRTIREDKERKGFLFAGTETGVYYSLNDGGSWDKLKANLPAVPVVDMKIKNEDLVIATNGRGLWIMDDITPLREKSEAIADKPVHLYSIPDHTRFGYSWWMDYVPGGDPGMKKNYFVQNLRPGHTYYELTFKKVNGERKRKFIDAGDAKSLGPVFYFKLEKEPQEIKIEMLDKSGKVLRTYTRDEMLLAYGKGEGFNTGLNKFVWDMRIDMLPTVPTRPPTTIIPMVPPGEYQARLTVDGTTETQRFKIRMNPSEPFTQAQAQAKFAFWLEMYNEAKIYTNKVITALEKRDEVLAKVKELEESGMSESDLKPIKDQASLIEKTSNEFEASFVSTGRTLAEIINLPATIFYKMSYISSTLDVTEGPQTTASEREFKRILDQAKDADAKFQAAIKPELAKFESLTK